MDLSRLAHDIRRPSTTPSYALIVPNLCHDGHDDPCVDGSPGDIARADAWLRREVPRILRSPGFRDNGLLVVTFDEAAAAGAVADSSACCGERPGPNTAWPGFVTPGPGGGRVGAVLVSPFIRGGTFLAEPYNHYGLLRSVEDLFHLGHPGFAAQHGLRRFGPEVFNRTPRLQLRLRPLRLRAGRRALLRIRVSRAALVRVGGACRRRSRRTRESGRLRLRVRAERAGRCVVVARRAGWRSARMRLRVAG